jgi:hypothetical protein
MKIQFSLFENADWRDCARDEGGLQSGLGAIHRITDTDAPPDAA